MTAASDNVIRGKWPSGDVGGVSGTGRYAVPPELPAVRAAARAGCVEAIDVLLTLMRGGFKPDGNRDVRFGEVKTDTCRKAALDVLVWALGDPNRLPEPGEKVIDDMSREQQVEVLEAALAKLKAKR